MKKINMGQNIFIDKIRKLYGDKFSFEKTKYIHTHAPITLTCTLHGDFTRKHAYQLFQGHHCVECQKIKLLEKRQVQFIKNSNKIHNNKYNYSFVEYQDARTKVKIICSIHGEFKQAPDSHIQKHGCPECARSFYGGEGVYCNNFFKSHKNMNGFLYIVEFFNNKEKFIKVGITKQNDIKKRYGTRTFYNYNVLFFQPMKLKSAYLIEQTCKKKYQKFGYKPKNKFHGYTECFQKQIKDQLLGDIINVR